MNLVERDLRARRLLELSMAHNAAIASGVGKLRDRSRENHYLRDVLEEYASGTRQTIDGLVLQKAALVKILDHIKCLCDEKGCRKKATKLERQRVLKEINRIDKEITRLEGTLVE